MTVTIDHHELHSFNNDMDRWRFDRDTILVRILEARVGKETMENVMEQYNEEVKKAPLPQMGYLRFP